MNYTPLPPRGFDEHEWHRVTTAAKKANDELDKRRVDRIQHMLDKNRAQSSDQQVQVILTGNASKSKTFLERLSAVVAKKYPEAKICHPSPGERTAVLAGLQYIAENPEFLHVTCAPLSFWLRSDADAGDGLAKRAIRVCRKNQQLNVQPASDYRVNDRDAFRPVHLELNKYGDGPFELDLSVFGTPSKVKDEDISTQYSHITRGRLEEGFVYARIEDLVRYGDFRTDVLLKDLPVDGICHVYVFSKLTAVEITLFAAFAANGREMKELESLGLIDVEGLKTHAAADVEVIRLGQVARLGTYQKEIRLHES
ncbi:hypothetical protein KC338_g6569 [Hortaea werneckii]|nr:hypothetical protein KC323_g7171 [Hortaea werneckii]KAI6861568.1 hypothetical protein KC338_g6569 [Hortaea werneckii]KAI7347887.1 hypothetical protein KC320_g6981 [Hortaea werneckii]